MLCEEERPITCNESNAWSCVSDSVVGILRASTMMEPSTSTFSARKVRFFLWLFNFFQSLLAILHAPVSIHCSWSPVSISYLYVGSFTGWCVPLQCFVFLASNWSPVRVCPGLAYPWFSLCCVGFSSRLWPLSNGKGLLEWPVKPHQPFLFSLRTREDANLSLEPA